MLSPTHFISPSLLLGWAFLLVTLIGFVVVLYGLRRFTDYLINSRVGISVLRTSVVVRIEDAKMERATVCREQLSHANQPGITAYRSKQRASAPDGKINLATHDIESHLRGEIITAGRYRNGGERGIELIESFKRPLPRNFLATYLPNSWVLGLFNTGFFFKGVVVKRITNTEMLLFEE